MAPGDAPRPRLAPARRPGLYGMNPLEAANSSKVRGGAAPRPGIGVGGRLKSGIRDLLISLNISRGWAKRPGPFFVGDDGAHLEGALGRALSGPLEMRGCFIYENKRLISCPPYYTAPSFLEVHFRVARRLALFRSHGRDGTPDAEAPGDSFGRFERNVCGAGPGSPGRPLPAEVLFITLEPREAFR